MSAGASSDMPLRDISNIESPTPGCRFEWVYNRRLACVSVNSPSRENVDAWIERTKEIKLQWSEEHPALILVFLEGGNIIPTPYAKTRLREIVEIRPDLEMYVAFVVKKNSLTQLFELTARSQKSKGRKTSIRVFFDRGAALQWLKQMGKIDD
jgi:hypothetical protein